MIHMLSRFDLKPGVTFEVFRERYWDFTEDMRQRGLVVSSGRIGRREEATPMDTDAGDAPEYYVIMSFRDRAQLDQAYDYLLAEMKRDPSIHNSVHADVRNAVFTCCREVG